METKEWDRCELLLKAMDSPVCCIDQKSNLRFSNQCFYKKFGITESSIGNDVRTLNLTQMDKKDLLLKISDLGLETLKHLEHKKRSIKGYEVSCIPNDDGKMCIIIIKEENNIAELRDELDDLRVRYAALNASRDIASAVMDPKRMTFSACNKQMLDMFGFESEAELENVTVMDVSPKYQPDGQLSLDKGIFYMDQTRINGSNAFEWTHISKEGYTFVTEVHLTAFGKNKEVVFCVFRKTEEEKVKNERAIKSTLEKMVTEKTTQLNNKIAELKSTQDVLVSISKQEVVNSIVSGIAHELGTPLGNGLTMVGFLKKQLELIDKKSPEVSLGSIDDLMKKIKDLVDIIERSVEQAAQKFNKIRETLLLAGPSANTYFKPYILLEDLIRNVFARKIDFEENLNMNFSKDVVLYGDEMSFKSIFVHLLKNSLEHSNRIKEELVIKVDIKVEETFSTIQLQDNGVGLQKIDSEMIFFPFVTNKRIEGNMGIGLTLVDNLISRMNGSIELLENAEGFGVNIKINN